jgi:bifunctional ADP-heptose synthase (sugar kinase/adenylyltransferase)
MSALRAVDYVVVFDSLRVTDVIRTVRPALYAKGGDYTVETLDAGERAALQEAGTEIHILPLVPGRSTTAILARAAQPEKA